MPALFAVPLAVLLFLLAFPLSMPLVALLHALDCRRLRAAASGTRCVRCGQALGQASLDAADHTRQAELAELHRRHPGMRLRIVRHCRALCPTCGAGYTWNRPTRVLMLLPEASWPLMTTPEVLQP